VVTDEDVERPLSPAGALGSADLFQLRISKAAALVEGLNRIGLPAALYDELGLASEPWVEVVGPNGRRVGATAVRMEFGSGGICATATFAGLLTDGRIEPIHVHIRPVKWPRSGPGADLDFSRALILPDRFSESRYAAGLTIEALRAAGLKPGERAAIQGPAGKQPVRVQIVDRGNSDVIWLSRKARLSVGVDDIDTPVRLQPLS
jgi:hypothetical protein